MTVFFQPGSLVPDPVQWSLSATPLPSVHFSVSWPWSGPQRGFNNVEPRTERVWILGCSF